ncbi:MAG: hypothetical protein H7146_04450 [Burkholderiaceae bacterium]|nr:hypothetical protein [Microbacteriaceae bacterium]
MPQQVQLLPAWILPSIFALLVIPLVIANPRRLSLETTWSRWLSIGISVSLALVNQVTIVLLIQELLDGSAAGATVLLTALQVWVTNVIAFGLVYWELDRGGPVARRVEGLRDDATQDFRFPQQEDPQQDSPSPSGEADAATSAWEPGFVDYAYFSLSNMMAFSPTDVMPLTHRAKLVMGYQALTGFILLALVISRAVNVLT